mgnify:CR=1 FL=1
MAHDEVLVAFELELGACILAIEYGIAYLYYHLLVFGAVAYGYYFALEGFLLGGVGDDDAADGLLFGRCGYYEHAVS